MKSFWSYFGQIWKKGFRNRSLCSPAKEIQEKCSVCGNIDPGNLYTQMLKQEAQMHWKYNALAGSANWILLAGYLVVPGTFISLNESAEVEQTLQSNDTGRAILKAIQNPPLLIIACIFLVVGALVLVWLYVIFRDSYTWLINRLFMPACLNAAAGLLTTAVNVFSSQSSQWSLMALVTVLVTGTTFAFCLGLIGIFKLWKLKKVIEEDELQHLSKLPKLILAAIKPV